MSAEDMADAVRNLGSSAAQVSERLSKISEAMRAFIEQATDTRQAAAGLVAEMNSPPVLPEEGEEPKGYTIGRSLARRLGKRSRRRG